MNRLVIACLLSCVFCMTGCSLLTPFVKDIQGWDLSACVGRDEFKVCKELFLDNKDNIFGGQETVDSVLGTMQVRTMELENE